MQQTNIKQKINIVYATDNNFSEIMGVSIISLFENNKGSDIEIYILDSGVTKENKEKVNMIFQQYGRKEPMWIKAININDILGIKVKQDRGSISQFARLFISRLLPTTISRVLYFDCDIIIRSSIKDLWNIELDDKIIAALKDPFSKYYRRNLGLIDDALLFNSGVMLIDCERWKKAKVENRLLKLIKRYNGLIPQGDQGALGAILSEDVISISPEFNAITLFYDFSYEEMMIYRKPVKGYYSKTEVENARANPVIVHFTTSFKSIRPWIENSKHPYAEEWLYYKKISPWKDVPIRKYAKTKYWKEAYIKLCNKFPEKIALHLSGLLQAYGRPWLIKIKYKIG